MVENSGKLVVGPRIVTIYVSVFGPEAAMITGALGVTG